MPAALYIGKASLDLYKDNLFLIKDSSYLRQAERLLLPGKVYTSKCSILSVRRYLLAIDEVQYIFAVSELYTCSGVRSPQHRSGLH